MGFFVSKKLGGRGGVGGGVIGLVREGGVNLGECVFRS